MQEEKDKKLPLDARLLSEAIIELNILRRNVGLYPPSHAIIKNSIARTFGLLRKLLDLRPEITLGIARDTLVVDEYALEKENPVFKEFALSVHKKGIASITFVAGVAESEVIALHELISMEDAPSGKAILEYWSKKGVRNIRLMPIDFSTFRFVAGKLRKTRGQGGEGEGGSIWEDYVYGLLEGKLIGGEEAAQEALLDAPPEHVAEALNQSIDEHAAPETYDGVISLYLRKKGQENISSEALGKFVRFTDNLNPELKQKFLSRAFERQMKAADVERAVASMGEEELEKLHEILSERGSLLPEMFKGLLDRLNALKGEKAFDFDIIRKEGAVFHDIELTNKLDKLFDEDRFRSFVSGRYQEELERMLREAHPAGIKAEGVELECSEEVTTAAASEILVELLESPLVGSEDYLKALTRLTEYIQAFMQTGKFEEILNVYVAVSSHRLQGRHAATAEATIEHFFQSESFISSLVSSFKFWGRQNRESVVRLARPLKGSLIRPLLDALADEPEAVTRKALLQILGGLGGDILPETAKRLDDPRWYVVRNMLYLIRETGGTKHVQRVRQFARHKNTRVSIESVRTLMHFGTPDALSYLRHFIGSEEPFLREQALRLAGKYRMKGIVPDLIALIEKTDFFGAGSLDRIAVIRALGRIGDERAVPALLKIFKSIAIFNRKSVEELKVEIFRSLSGYPPGAARLILEAGLKSDVEEIKTISLRLSVRTGKEG